MHFRWLVTPANEQDWAQVAALAKQVQAATGDAVKVTFVDPGYTEEQAAEYGLRLGVVKLLTAKRGFILLPRRWVVERNFAWMARCRRLVQDDECLDKTLAGLHFVTFAILMAQRFIPFMTQIS